jgi:hypothetical protein
LLYSAPFHEVIVKSGDETVIAKSLVGNDRTH